MSFPSPQSLFDLFDNMFSGLPSPVKEFIRCRVLKQYMENAQGSAPSAEFIDSIRVQLNEILRHGGVGTFGRDLKEVKRQKALAKDAVRTCFTLLFYTHMVCTNSSKLLNMEDFLIKYPAFRSLDSNERELLHKFRNYTVAFMAFRPAKDNKAKCLFAAGVLSLEEHFVYKTGSGQSDATRRRVEIYEREGNITPQPSKKHTVNPKVVVSSDASGAGSLTTTESSLGKRSRRSCSDLDDDVSVSSELTADSKRSRTSSLGSVDELDFYIGLFDRDEKEIKEEVDRNARMASVPFVLEPSSLLTTTEEEEFASLSAAFEALSEELGSEVLDEQLEMSNEDFEFNMDVFDLEA